MATFEVEDSGIGIREMDQEIIFSPFEQIGEQMATQSGTGLGLAICKQFVELMGGNIGVTSELGKGSVFHFEIPAIIAAPASKPATVPYHERIIGLDEEQLKKIPSNLLHNLLQGAVLLDEAQCFKVIGMIGDHNHGIGESLRRSVEALQYKEILTTLEKLTGTGISEQG